MCTLPAPVIGSVDCIILLFCRTIEAIPCRGEEFWGCEISWLSMLSSMLSSLSSTLSFDGVDDEGFAREELLLVLWK